MLNKWTLGEKLADLRNERKLYLRDVEEATKIPLSTLQRMESDPDMRIGYQDVITLAKFYEVSTDYLFCLSHTKMPYNQELSELSLTERVVDLLKSRDVNNRLLCEFVEHSDFPKFMAALEMYVDRKILPNIDNAASYKIAEQALNADGKTPEKADILTYIKEAMVDEDSYLRYRISERFNLIIQDLFDKHRNDPLVEVQEQVIEEIADDLGFYLANTDNAVKAKMTLLAKQLGLDISSLTPDELKALMKALEKSKVFKGAVGKRKKR